MECQLTEFNNLWSQQKKTIVASLIPKLESSKSAERSLKLIRMIISIRCPELSKNSNMLAAIDQQIDKYGMNYLFQYIELLNSTVNSLYSSFSGTIYQCLCSEEKIGCFVETAAVLLQTDQSMSGTVFYVLKIIVYRLLENDQMALVDRVLDKVMKSNLFKYSDERSIKNVQCLLEIILKQNLKENQMEKCLAAIQTVDEMNPKPYDIFFNKILDYMAKNKYSVKFSDSILSVMIRNKVKASLITFNTLLDLYVSQKNFQMAGYLFESLIRTRDPTPDSFTYSIMISSVKYMKRQDIQRAFHLFDMYRQSLPAELIVLNSLMDVCACFGRNDLVISTMDTIKELGLKPDQVSYNILIKSCAKSGQISRAEEYFELMKQQGLKPSKVTFNSMMDICAKNHDADKASFYLKEMKGNKMKPDEFSYSILFNNLKNNSTDKNLYNQTIEQVLGYIGSGEVKPDEVFFNSLLDLANKFDDVERVNSLFNLMTDLKIKPTTITMGILIKSYGKSRQTERAIQVFESMRDLKIEPNDITYGCFIEALCLAGRMDYAERVFLEIPTKKVPLNPILFTTLIKGFTKQQKYGKAIEIFERMKGSNIKPTLISFNCMIDVAAKKQNMKLALEYLQQLKESYTPDLITYSCIIKGFNNEKASKESLKFLREMIGLKISPDLAIFNQIMEACSDMHSYQEGLEAYALLKSSSCVANQVTYGTLVKLMGFAKQHVQAFDICADMKAQKLSPSVIFYTNLSHICFANRRADLAEKAFELMIKDQLIPDEICVSKMINGYTRAKQFYKAMEMIRYARKMSISVKKDSLEKLKDKIEETNPKKFTSEIKEIDLAINSPKILTEIKNRNDNALNEIHIQTKSKNDQKMVFDETKENMQQNQFSKGNLEFEKPNKQPVKFSEKKQTGDKKLGPRRVFEENTLSMR